MNELPPNLKAATEKPSPASRLLGLELRDFDLDAGRVELAFTPSESLLNKFGAVQGGMVAAMLDEAVSLASGLVLEWGQIVPTLEMKVSFLNGVKPGRVLAEAEVVKRGKSIVFVEARLRDEAGQILATASATSSIVTLKPKDPA